MRFAIVHLVVVCLISSAAALIGCTDRPVDVDAGARPDRAEQPATRPEALAKSFHGQEVWFVGGFMSQLYDALSGQLEDEVNEALQRGARSLNVHLELPGGRSLDIELGDAIADALPRIDLPIEHGRFMSFYPQMQDFDAKGIPYRNISLVSAAFNTSQSVEHNAAAILALLQHTDKQVIFVTHSKGGLDTLHALLQAPELWGKTVIGWVALQAPFYGSPLADPSPVELNGLLLEALGGNGQAVEDLKTTTRMRYMQEHATEIEKLTARIPVIAAYTTFESNDSVSTFAETLANGVFSADLVTRITEIVSFEFAKTPNDLPRVIGAAASQSADLIARQVTDAWTEAVGTVSLLMLPNVYLRDIFKVPNDGLVPEPSTRLPGAEHRDLPTGDHASPVMDVEPFKSFWSDAQRNDVTLGLIDEVRDHSPNRR